MSYERRRPCQSVPPKGAEGQPGEGRAPVVGGEEEFPGEPENLADLTWRKEEARRCFGMPFAWRLSPQSS